MEEGLMRVEPVLRRVAEQALPSVGTSFFSCEKILVLEKKGHTIKKLNKAG
jgi:hypothetical protein